MADELEVIRDEMEQTRANLAGKLEALETQVRETVSGASEAVTSTVEGVKEVVSSVSETVGSVTETLNISKQVEQHPWAAVGIAVATGFVAAQLFGRSSSPATGAPQPQHAPPAPPPQPSTSYQPAASSQPAVASNLPRSMSDLPMQTPGESKGIVDSLAGLLPEGLSGALPGLDDLIPDMSGAINTAITGLSGLAVGTVMGVVREVAANGLPPEWKSELTRLVDDMTKQLGGKPLKVEKPQESNGVHPKAERSEDRLSRLEDLPSPLPPHQENVTEPPLGGESKQKRGGRQVGNKA